MSAPGPSGSGIRSGQWVKGKLFLHYQGEKLKPIIIPLSLSSLFLIQCSSGYLQVDTGYELDYTLYRRNLTKAGIKLEEIKYLFLTHHHDDHAGFLNELTRDAELTIIVHEQAKELLKTGKNDKSRGGGYVNGVINFVACIKMRLDPRWTLSFQPFTLRERDILVSADDDKLLRKIGIEGRILTTPGHCVDHIAIVLDNGDAFCGDAAASFLLAFGTHYCTVFMTNMEDAYRSWQKMLDARAKMIYPAHGKPFSGEKLRNNMGKFKTKDLIRFF